MSNEYYTCQHCGHIHVDCEEKPKKCLSCKSSEYLRKGIEVIIKDYIGESHE